MTRSTPPPRLAIVLTGRNDGYGGDFVARTITAMRFNHQVLRDAGLAHEFMLVEWAPPPDRPLLSQLIEEAVPEAAPHLSTWLVDPAYHDALTLHPRLAYLEFVAKNVAIRRARSELVLATNADVLLGRAVLAQLQEAIATPAVYRAPRIDLVLGIGQSGLSWETLEDPGNHWRTRDLEPPLYSGGTGDFLLATRATFHALRGFNEIYRLARVAVDFNFLVKAYGAGVPIVKMTGCVYHINHAGSYRISRTQTGTAAEAAWGQRGWHSRYVSYENAETWGLALAPEEQVGPRRTRLVFDWAAVPPLLDLKRMVIPTRRAAAAPRESAAS